MATTKTAQQGTAAPPLQPAPQLPAVKKLSTWEGFRDELNARADEIGSQLPSTIKQDRFTNAAIAAVKANPEILTATPRSLFSALVKAAQDGLLPDGREGVITVYNQKIKDSKPQRYEMVAQWNPMFYGIRKRAREIDGIIIDAQVVAVGDEYDFELGDNPHITHKPAAREGIDKRDASTGVAVYAIFRHPQHGILHREWMWKREVFDVMEQSRNKGGLMWTTFWTEGWRKTVGRRGAKSVPMSPQLERVIQRIDEDFDFSQDNRRSIAAPPPPPPPPPEEPDTVEDYLAKLEEALKGAATDEEVDVAFDKDHPQERFPGDDDALARAFTIKASRKKALKTEPVDAEVVEDPTRPFPGDDDTGFLFENGDD